ncbi:AAA-domain-containing protein [Mycena indigotica]|uniref:vesicle-fusing ATPase n=1 Tax=Mycena indigotica TaxID=2126181 RepID=A0A8H6T8U9_9AGAR|nr:AAA-domain-containing protein [Mycena indigotica]KAF7312087.1 AAA-domain-containing protein [Mycena indigotica]
MSPQTSLNKAIEIVERAIQHDKAQNHQQACKDYMDALDYFMLALKYEKNEQFKILIRSKIDDYLARAEILKKTLSPPSPTVSAARAVKQTDATDDPETKKLRAGLAEAIISTSGSSASTVTWDDIAGLEAAKQALKEAVVIPMMFPHLFAGRRRPVKGILLYGPPGNGEKPSGKSSSKRGQEHLFQHQLDRHREQMARGVREVSCFHFMPLSLTLTPRLVRHLFEMAREMRPTVIFIDEVDSLTGARGDGDSEATRRLKTEFLVQMDGLGRDDSGILVIGATNIPWAIDLSIKRRFERRIYIPLPNGQARKEMFKLHVGGTPSELTDADYELLAQKTEGYSGADVSLIVQDAFMQPIRNLMTTSYFKALPPNADSVVQWVACHETDEGAVKKGLAELKPEEVYDPVLMMADFSHALGNVRPTVTEKDLEGHTKWTEEFGSYGS